MNPLVTICLPSTGRMRFLPLVIASITEQLYQNYEVLILDNASPSETRQVFERYATADIRVRVLCSETRLPMFANFNRGLRAAQGEFVTFFHDDDVYLPTFLVKMVGALRAYPSAAFAGSNYYRIDDAGMVLAASRSVVRGGLMNGRDFIRGLMRTGRNSLAAPGLMYRKAAFDERLFDESLPMHFGDFVILMRMVEERDVAIVEDYLMLNRLHAESATNSLSVIETMRLRRDVLRAYCGEYATRYPDQRAFIGELETLMRLVERKGALWGCLGASDREEFGGALDDVDAAGGSNPQFDRLTRSVVATLFRSHRIRSRSREVARAIGRRLDA